MKVFLGGTINDSNWREQLILLLEKEAIEYFNPVVDDWDEKAQRAEVFQRSNCDFCIYGITPKMKGCYSVAEVVNDSYHRPKKVILFIMKEDGGSTFDDEQWKSICSIGALVSSNGSFFTTQLEELIQYLKLHITFSQEGLIANPKWPWRK